MSSILSFLYIGAFLALACTSLLPLFLSVGRDQRDKDYDALAGFFLLNPVCAINLLAPKVLQDVSFKWRSTKPPEHIIGDPGNAKLVRHYPGVSRQKSLSTAGTHLKKPCAHHLRLISSALCQDPCECQFYHWHDDIPQLMAVHLTQVLFIMEYITYMNRWLESKLHKMYFENKKAARVHKRDLPIPTSSF